MKYLAAMAQILVEGGQADANLRRAERAIAEAANQRCRLVVLPECMDFGWTDPSATRGAAPIPGAISDRLAGAARRHNIHVVAGLVERFGDRLYNAAVIIDPSGAVRLLHRKINELNIGLELYSVGDRLGVAETDLGTLGLNICADNFGGSLALGHSLARMGAQVIVSPSAWAVDAGHDNEKEPYGQAWVDSYAALAKLYDLYVLGVSNVGAITAGPWAGRHCIGCSLAVGPEGNVLARGAYGVNAEDMVVMEIETRPRRARGTLLLDDLRRRGYSGP